MMELAQRICGTRVRQAVRRRIAPMQKVASALRVHRALILNYFRAREEFSSGGIPILPISCLFLLGCCTGRRVRKYPRVREHNY
jgi:hypothetical protein